MANGEFEFRLNKGLPFADDTRWQFRVPGGEWMDVDDQTQAELKPYVKYEKDTGFFVSGDGSKIAEGVLLGDALTPPEWWSPEVEKEFGPYPPYLRDKDGNIIGAVDSDVVTKALTYARGLLNYNQDRQQPGTPGVAGTKSVSPRYWPEDILGPYPTQEEATAAGVTVGQLAQERVTEYQTVQKLKADQTGGFITSQEAQAAGQAQGLESYFDANDQIWKLRQPAPAKQPGSTEEVMAGLVAKAVQDGNWDAAIQLDDFLKRPSDKERLDAALAYATSPADYLTVVGMMRGELPIQAQQGGFGRIAPPADFLQGAAQKFFNPTGFGQGQGAGMGFGKSKQPALGAGTQAALPPGGGGGTQTTQQTQMFLDNPSMFDPNYDTASPEAQQAIIDEIKRRGATTGTSQPSGPRMGETEISPGVFYSPTGGVRMGATPDQRQMDNTIQGVGTTGFAAVESPGFMANLRNREAQLRGVGIPNTGFGTTSTPSSGEYVPTAQDLATPAGKQWYDAQGKPIDTPSWAGAWEATPEAQAYARRKAQTGFGQYPSHIQDALGSELLSGAALTPRKTFPELGALRFPSAQALNTMTPTERDFFVQALKEQGVSGSNLDTYNEQLNRTIRPAGGRKAQYGFAVGRA